MIKQFPIKSEYSSDLKSFLVDFNKQNALIVDRLNQKTSFDSEQTITTLSNYTSHGWNVSKIKNQLTTSVKRVTISQLTKSDNSTVNSPTSVQWAIDGADIAINYITGLDNSTTYNVRLKIE